MDVFIAEVLGRERGVDAAPADAVIAGAMRLMYWRRYGATLLGMIKHHAVRQEDFLRHAHRFDDLPAMIRAERGLQRFFRRLPGRKILFTNAPRNYAHQVLRHLGLHRHFAQHFPIESMRVHRILRPKPSKQVLRKLLAGKRVPAHRCILVEDTLSNLKAAKSLGMRTVWVTRYLSASSAADRAKCLRHPAYVDVKVKSIKKLTDQLHRLR